jgi:hypothetical protein
MKIAFLLAALALPWASGQIRIKNPAAPVSSVTPAASRQDKRLVPRQAFATLENDFDTKLAAIGGPDSLQLLGRTRGLYLDGYGVVFTMELSLAYPPVITPFHTEITDQEKQGLHKAKLAHLPLLRGAMHNMMVAAGKNLESLPSNEQIVLSVRLLYLPWEDTSGLPGEILMRADRQSALVGKIQAEDH